MDAKACAHENIEEEPVMQCNTITKVEACPEGDLKEEVIPCSSTTKDKASTHKDPEEEAAMQYNTITKACPDGDLKEEVILPCSSTNKDEIVPSLEEDKTTLYKELEDLSSDQLVYYADRFDCPVCFDSFEELKGIILKECLHVFCRDCLLKHTKFSETIDVICPFSNKDYSCSSTLLENEIKSLLSPDDYEKRLWKTLAFAETSMKDTFHCKTPDCIGWCIIGDSQVFSCPICSIINCIACKAIHEGITCGEYQDVLANKSGVTLSSKLSEAAVRDMIQDGIAMKCSQCGAVITKQEGCDGLTCSFCQTLLCWATKGPRWGPGGRGDSSGGCQCNVNGRKCHPQCQNCH